MKIYIICGESPISGPTALSRAFTSKEMALNALRASNLANPHIGVLELTGLVQLGNMYINIGDTEKVQ